MISTVTLQQVDDAFGSLSQPKDKQIRSTGNSKFPVGVNVSVNDCLSLCVSPVTDW